MVVTTWLGSAGSGGCGDCGAGSGGIIAARAVAAAIRRQPGTSCAAPGGEGAEEPRRRRGRRSCRGSGEEGRQPRLRPLRRHRPARRSLLPGPGAPSLRRRRPRLPRDAPQVPARPAEWPCRAARGRRAARGLGRLPGRQGLGLRLRLPARRLWASLLRLPGSRGSCGLVAVGARARERAPEREGLRGGERGAGAGDARALLSPEGAPERPFLLRLSRHRLIVHQRPRESLPRGALPDPVAPLGDPQSNRCTPVYSELIVLLCRL